MEKLRKVVEIGSNVAIILVALLAGFFLVNRYYSQPAQHPVAAESSLKPGKKLQIKDVDFSKSDRNLMLVLSTSCHFCAESMPFYERLANQISTTKRVRFIAAFPQEVEEAQNYLKGKNVIIDEVIKARPGEAMARGTPTLILLDKNGVILESWIGKLSPDKESEVFEKLTS